MLQIAGWIKNIAALICCICSYMYGSTDTQAVVVATALEEMFNIQYIYLYITMKLGKIV